VSFESSLNLVWLFLGVLALASSLQFTYQKRGLQGRKLARLHIVGVGLIVAALFPYISATDDVLRIEHASEQQKSDSTQKSHSNELMRLYQTMDAPLLSVPRQTCLTLFFVMVMGMLVVQLLDRSAPSASGRSPPRLVCGLI
jgi:hypothetical protein